MITLERADAEPARTPAAGLDGHVLQSAYLGTSVSHQVQTCGGAKLTVVVPRSHERVVGGDSVRIRWNASDAKVLPRLVEAAQKES